MIEGTHNIEEGEEFEDCYHTFNFLKFLKQEEKL